MKNYSNNKNRQDLIDFLIDRYVNDKNPYRIKKETKISSHWDKYLNLFKIRLDSQGKLSEVIGEGFGTYKIGKIDLLMDRISIQSYMMHLPQSGELKKLLRKYKPLINKMGFQITFDVFRHICTLELLSKFTKNISNSGKISFVIIGDGYGLLAALLKAEIPQSEIYLVDLGQILLAQVHHINLAHPDKSHRLADSNGSTGPADFNYCPSDQFETRLSSCRFDVAVNICSMQEMNMEIISKYFDFLRKKLKKINYFYCCNRLHKKLVGCEIVEFMKFPWKQKDKHLIDELTPWQRYFFAPWKAQKGPKIMGFRVPFVNYYDGNIHHRLTLMSTGE